MKLIKIHLLRHFVECIKMYGSAVNFNGATSESHLKNKTKQPAWRTKMRPVDMEYQTAMKDYEQMVLAQGIMAIRNLGEVIKRKRKNGNSDWLGHCLKVKKEDEEIILKWNWWKKIPGTCVFILKRLFEI